MEEAPDFFQNNFSPSDNNTSTSNVNASTDGFIVEDLFDFSNDDDAAITDPIFDDSLPANSSAASHHLDTTVTTTTTTTHDNSNFLADGHFSNDLPVPYDDLAELEWLSKFADESFSNEDVHNMELTSNVKGVNEKSFSSEEMKKMQMISSMKGGVTESFSSDIDAQKMQLNDATSQTCEEADPIFNPQVARPAKARTKRSRSRPSSGKWNSQLVLSPTTTTSSSHYDTIVPPPKKHVPRRRDSSDGCDGRKCLHCATDKTPQWRTGPLGPKTLCNACGVRYKSGRLVPEYRPAASPTFMLTKHSNSHRKVLELRRQKEMMRAQQQQQQQVLQLHHQQSMMFEHIPSSNSNEYFHQHLGSDFTHHLI